MEGSLTYKIDRKTQEMLQSLATAKNNLDMQQKIIFQVLLNQYDIPGDARIEVAPDFSMLTAQAIVPTNPVPELSTGPLLKEKKPE